VEILAHIDIAARRPGVAEPAEAAS
jgi:hypothetical protein